MKILRHIKTLWIRYRMTGTFRRPKPYTVAELEAALKLIAQAKNKSKP